MILFDLSFVRGDIHSGVAKYAYRILDYFVISGQADRYTLVVNYLSRDYFERKYPQFSTIVIGTAFQSKIPILRTILLSFEFRRAVNASGSGTVFCPWANFITFFPNKAKAVSVIHDMQQLLDMKGAGRLLFKLMYDMIIRNSVRIVTISEFSKAQIEGLYPKLHNKISNLGNSVSMPEVQHSCPLVEGKYILYVGRLCKMKNVLTLVKAFALLSGKYDRYRLVLVGDESSYYRNVLKPTAESLGVSERVVLMSGCSEEELSVLYRDAAIFVFPSLREGFGFPPVEAALLMTPVITTECDALKEVTKGLLNYYNNPTDEVELSEKMTDLLENYPSKASLETVRRKFEWAYPISGVGTRVSEFLREINV